MSTVPIDGFTVFHEGGEVTLALTNRYGDVESYRFGATDAATIGAALILHARLAMADSRGTAPDQT